MTHPTGSPAAPTWPRYARAVIERAVRERSIAPLPGAPDDDRAHGGVFVTLHRLNHLRGCMGLLDPQLTRATAVHQAAVSAALHDPRFPAVTTAELADLAIEVSILAAPIPLRRLEDLELGRHGIIVQRGGRRGLFLPQVATDHHMSREAFLSRCCAEKAGLPADAWRDPDTTVEIFTTEVYADDVE